MMTNQILALLETLPTETVLTVFASAMLAIPVSILFKVFFGGNK